MTRVIVCGVASAGVLRAVVRDHPGLEWAATVDDPEALECTLVATGASSVLLGAEVSDPVGRCQRLLARFPDLRILVLCNAERSAVLLRPGLPPRELRSLSLSDLLESMTVRTAREARQP